MKSLRPWGGNLPILATCLTMAGTAAGQPLARFPESPPAPAARTASGPAATDQLSDRELLSAVAQGLVSLRLQGQPGGQEIRLTLTNLTPKAVAVVLREGETRPLRATGRVGKVTNQVAISSPARRRLELPGNGTVSFTLQQCGTMRAVAGEVVLTNGKARFHDFKLSRNATSPAELKREAAATDGGSPRSCPPGFRSTHRGCESICIHPPCQLTLVCDPKSDECEALPNNTPSAKAGPEKGAPSIQPSEKRPLQGQERPDTHGTALLVTGLCLGGSGAFVGAVGLASAQTDGARGVAAFNLTMGGVGAILTIIGANQLADSHAAQAAWAHRNSARLQWTLTPQVANPFGATPHAPYPAAPGIVIVGAF